MYTYAQRHASYTFHDLLQKAPNLIAILHTSLPDVKQIQFSALQLPIFPLLQRFPLYVWK